jgi:acid phosphatase type 7
VTDGPADPASPDPGPRDVTRQIALGGIVFVATLVLLGGLLAVIGRPGASAAPGSQTASLAVATSEAPGPSPTATSTAGPSGSAPQSQAPTARPSGSAGPTPAATASPGDPVLVGAGDIGDCTSPGDEQTAAQIKKIPGTVFTAGDDAYPDGSLKHFQDCYGATWGQFKDRTKPAPGNHEWETADAAGYTAYFGALAKPDGTLWYSYDLGTWHVIVLDSDCTKVNGCGPSSAQGRWLAKDLAASKATCTVAIFHHPRFSSGLHANNSFVAPFWQALYAAGADLIINGHDHDYERFAPQDPNGDKDTARGIREFVVGTGGTALRPFTHTAANSQFREAIDHGVIKLTLHPGSYEWSFLPEAGGFNDAGSGICH